MNHYEIPKSPQTPLAIASLLEEIEAPFDLCRMPQDQMVRIYEAAKRVREAEAADEIASWQVSRKRVEPREVFPGFERLWSLQWRQPKGEQS